MIGKWLGGEIVGVNICFFNIFKLIDNRGIFWSKSDKNIDFIFLIRNW